LSTKGKRNVESEVGILNLNSVLTGFVTGIVCGAVFLIGSWLILIPKIPSMMRQEMLKDLSHYGRSAGKSAFKKSHN